MSQPQTLPQVLEHARPDGLEPHWTDRVYHGLTGRAWARIAVMTLLFAALFWPNLRRLWLKTNPFTGEPNWGHAIFVPIIGLYYLYLNRQAIAEAAAGRPDDGSWRGGVAWLLLQAHWPFALAAIFLLDISRLPPGRVFLVAAVSWAAANLLLLTGPGRAGLAWLRERVAPLAAWLMFQVAAVVTLLAFWAYKPATVGAWLPAVGIAWLVALVAGPLALGHRTLAALLARAGHASASWFGCFTLLWGVWFYAYAIWPGQNDFFKDFGMVVALFGLVLMLGGWAVMRLVWFPIAFLVCAFPWPQLVYSGVAVPLQFLAAEAASFVLNLSGLRALREGSVLWIGPRALNVAEACAGLKSLMTFVSVAAAVGFLSARPTWQKVVVAVSGVPIAILCNMIRVAGQGLLDSYVSHEISEGFAHSFVGLIMLIPAFFMILGVAWVMDRLFVEEPAADSDDADDDGRRAAAVAAAAASGASSKELVIELPPRRRRPAGTVARGATGEGRA